MHLALMLLPLLWTDGGAAPAAGAAGGAQALPPLFGRPRVARPPLSEEEKTRRRAAFLEHLEEEGLVVEDDIVAPPWYFDDEPDPGMPRAGEWTQPPHRGTIFLNFFGGTLSKGTNSARMESSCIAGGEVDYPAYANSESLALAIVQIFQNKMDPYGVRIAYEKAPPPELPYQMVMMGGSPGVIGMPPGVLGVSCSSDCGDQWWRDTTFAFTEESAQATTLGTTALQEAAHAFGLAHIDGSQHIMYPFASPGDKIWSTSCTPYNDATGSINCKPTHDIFCSGGAQNDDAELMAYFGPNGPDTEPPTVTITDPTEDVLEVDPGTNVTVSAEVTDNFEGAGWKFVVIDDQGNEVVSQPAFTFETSWTVALPEGVFTLRVQAIDHDRNIGSDEVTVYSGVEAPAGTTGGTTGDTAGGTEGGTDSVGMGPMEDEGCGCATPGAPRGRWGALAFVLLAATGARRRRGA